MFFAGIEKSSLVDFDGKLACTVFTHGCNFLCPFCHNSGLVIGNANVKIPEEEVLSFLNKRKGILDGICVTGGEPTLHKGLKDFFIKVRETGFSIKLDTNGTNPDFLQELIDLKLIDYVAMDIKTSFDRYPDIIGVNNIDIEKIKASIGILLRSTIEYEFRTTIIGGHHTAEDFEKISGYVVGAKKYCLQKFEDKGNCIQSGLYAVEKDDAMNFATILKKSVENVKLRGY